MDQGTQQDGMQMGMQRVADLAQQGVMDPLLAAWGDIVRYFPSILGAIVI